MLHVDIPTRSELSALATARADACVSIYVRTPPAGQDGGASRIELGNLVREAERQLQAVNFDKRRLASLLEGLQDVLDDDAFWRQHARSLAIFATADRVQTFRLANELQGMVQVSDRFHIKSLFRAATFSHSAFVLALSENAVRLIEMHADLPPSVVKVPDMPRDAASAVGKSTINDRTFSGRVHGSEGQNVRFQQYVRQVDAALRPILAGRETPLILASTGRLAAIFRQLSSYPYLQPEGVEDSPDRMTDGELAAAARPALDAGYARQIADVRRLYEERGNEGRAVGDISDAARAATRGAVDTLLVDMDSVVPGFVEDGTGAVRFVEEDDARAYGVVDEIAARAYASGARVLAVRRDDIPGGGELAAILRYAA